MLHDEGNFAGARLLYETLGPEHPYTAASLASLASLLRVQRDFTGARPLYERALAICESDYL